MKKGFHMQRPKFKILSSATYFPEKKLYSHTIDQELNLPPGTIFNKSGVRVRSIAADNETQSKMGKMAALAALKKANMAFEDLDALVCSNGVTQQLIPCNAALLQREMGFGDSGVACFDVNSTCLSFLTALDMVSNAMAMGRFRKVMIVTSDIASVGINWKDLESASLFGDASVAYILGAPAEESEDTTTVLSAHMKTFADAADFCQVKSGGAAKLGFNYRREEHDEYLFAMDGPKVFKRAAQYIHRFVEETLDKAGCTFADLDHIVPHQASRSAMELIRRRLNVSTEQFHTSIFEDIGNCIAASIPIVLHDVIEKNKIHKGQKVLLLGTGAGLSFGAILLEY
jgi:3-oxoacyl-[acyl-carrier-protein] synthase-3